MISLTTVTDLQVKGELNFLKGTYNIIDCGIRTGKTYWAVNHLKQFSRDERLDRNNRRCRSHIVSRQQTYCYEVSPDNTGCYIINGKKIVTKIKHLETM